MNLEIESETGKVSAQFPDVWLSLYPAGHRVVDGKEDHYRGALVIRRGTETVHLNALDIGDVLLFLADSRVVECRKSMTREHVATNLLRALILERSFGDDSDDDE